MTPAQCRGARGLLNMAITALAVAAGVSATIVWDYESDIEFVPPVHVNAMRAALEKAGIEFIEDAVKLRKSR